MSGYPLRKDILRLSVEYLGRPDVEGHYYADAGTACRENIKNKWDKILPALDWDYYDSL